MPSLITKRGTKRWRGTIMVKGQRRDRLFPDNSKETYRQAVLWEKKEKERLEQELTVTDCLAAIDWAEQYLDYVKNRFVETTYKEKRAAFAVLFQSISCDLALVSMVPAVVMKHLMKQADTRSGNAANKDRKNLAAGWEWGRKYLDGFPQDVVNPFRAVEKFAEKRSPRYVPPEKDFWAVFNIAKDQDRVMLLTCLHLAARRSEIFNLTWDDVDFGNSQIRIWTSKRQGGTREFDWLPMTSELKRELKGWWQE